MRRLQLYIENQRVDLFKDESVSLTQTIKNVKDIAKVFTEFTQTFAVPASSVNNKIFQHYYNFEIRNGFDARIKVNARIELNDLPFKEGKISLQGVELKTNLAHTYKITFFGNTVNLKDILGDASLSSLSFPSLNTVYEYSTLVNSLSPSNGVISGDIIAPLITHTNRLIYNSNQPQAFNLEEKTNNVYADSDVANNGVLWTQFKYAIRVQAIIDAIELVYPKINFSNDFFNDTTNEKFYNLFMWLHRKSGDVEPATQVEVIYTKLTDLISTNTVADPAIVSSENGGIIMVAGPPFTFGTNYFPVRMRIRLDPNSNINNYGWQVIKNGGTIISNVSNGNGSYDFSITNANNAFEDNASYLIQFQSPLGVVFNAGDIKIDIIYSVFPGGGGLPFQEEDTYENASTVTISANPDFEFNIVEQIPKIKIIDFLSGLFNMFNLTAFIDKTGKIIVRTLDSYYAASTNIYNIDEYLDTTKSTVDIALPFKEINFSYKGLGTFLAKQFNQLTNVGWGSLSYKLDGQIFDTPSEAYKVEVPFEHMMFERLYDANTTLASTTSTNIQYGYSVNENEQSYIGSPLLFYPVIAGSATQKLRIRDTQSVGVSDLNLFISPSNTLTLNPNPIGSDVSLHFQNELSEYLANELSSSDTADDFIQTLFESEYKNYIQDVFNLNRRLIKVTAYLPMKVYYNLQLNDLIEIGQDRYKINSLTTDLTTGKTEFELLNTIL